MTGGQTGELTAGGQAQLSIGMHIQKIITLHLWLAGVHTSLGPKFGGARDKSLKGKMTNVY